MRKNVASGNDVLLRERVLVRCRVFIDEHTLDAVLLFVRYPDEVVRDLFQIVAYGEVNPSSYHFGDNVPQFGLLVEQSVGDDPVPLGLLDGSGDVLTVFFKDNNRGIRA